MWRLDAARLSRVSSALVAEVQAEANLMPRAKSGEKGLSESSHGQSFNSEQAVICYMPSVCEIWSRENLFYRIMNWDCILSVANHQKYTVSKAEIASNTGKNPQILLIHINTEYMVG